MIGAASGTEGGGVALGEDVDVFHVELVAVVAHVEHDGLRMLSKSI